MQPTEKQLAQFKLIKYGCKVIKEYYTIEFVGRKGNVYGVVPSKFPENKNPDRVGFLEVNLPNGKILYGLTDTETNKPYFSQSDIDLILSRIFKK